MICTRQSAVTEKDRPRRTIILLALIPLLVTVCGCPNLPVRTQPKEDVDHENYEVRTIGDITTVAHADPIVVGGVGLVTGLERGGDVPPGEHRKMLEAQLLKQGVDDPKKLLSSPDASLVIVSALIPPGIRKGDPLDVQVILPPESKTTSLRGGYLKECVLYNYDSTSHLSGGQDKKDQGLLGHPLAKAAGPVVVGLGEGDDSAKLKQGCVWNGGQSNLNRSFGLCLNEGQRSFAIAKEVADRINRVFHGPANGPHGGVMAAPRSNVDIDLDVPTQYRDNMPHYLRVVRLIPLTAGAGRAQEGSQYAAYRKKLEEDLLDPARTVTAALRLEALGLESAPVLKRGLTSQCPLVRFCSAEALAYLGSQAGVECADELARMAVQQPTLRRFCLTALAALGEGAAHMKLSELLVASDPEVRYGAFWALRLLDEHDSLVQGELLNHSFWLHSIVAECQPSVHITTDRRSEIVLFGNSPSLQGAFSLLAGQFSVTVDQDEEVCTVSRFLPGGGVRRQQSSLELQDVVRAMADLGCSYPEIVEFFQKAADGQHLNCKVAVNALPPETSVFDLVKAGKAIKNGQATEKTILKVQGE